jgi:pimeloyl-ACP methyl ester carboxylesterase
VIEHLGDALGPWGDVWIRSGWRVQIHCTTGEARVLDPERKRVAEGAVENCTRTAIALAPSVGAKHAVVLLHGIWDSAQMMAKLANALETDGYAIANVNYPSTRLPVAENAVAVSGVAHALAKDGACQISFVGFSLGGLVARAAMARAEMDCWRPGRLVLIGSPARGSTFAERFRNVPGYRTVIGACSQDVTPQGAIMIPEPRCKDVMVIAGGTGGRGYNPLIPGDNDRVIAVEETRMRDHETEFLLVHSVHKALPMQGKTISACRNFLAASKT